MTATGIQLTQYRPAFAGWVGAAQPYVLAGLVHVAITYYYLRLSWATEMRRRELVSMIIATPFVIVFAAWTVFMSSYSIMFERRTETARVESGNQLQSIADELRTLDEQVAANYVSTMANLGQRLEGETLRPEPGVTRGCGKRCKEIRAVQSELQNFQHLGVPVLGSVPVGADMAKALGVLEGEHQVIAARLADFEAVLAKFSRLNAVLAERLVGVEETASRLSGQFRTQLDHLRIKLVELRGDQRNLTDDRFRGLTELVKDVSAAIRSGQIARLLDLFTVVLIAAAPDFLSLIMVLLARTLVTGTPSVPAPATPVMAQPVASRGRGWWKGVNRPYTGGAAAAEKVEVNALKSLVRDHLSASLEDEGDIGSADEEDGEPSKQGASASEQIYEQLDKMDMPLPFRRRRPPGS